MDWPQHLPLAGLLAQWRHTESYVAVIVSGEGSAQEVAALCRCIADDAPSWSGALLMLDLSGLRRTFSRAEQFMLGQEMARCFAGLIRTAVIAAPGKRSAVGERAARLAGANLRVFDDEHHALDWLLEL